MPVIISLSLIVMYEVELSVINNNAIAWVLKPFDALITGNRIKLLRLWYAVCVS